MISACILAKNEESCIQQAILSIKPFVSEVIVVNDHSSDRTTDIAKQNGAQVYQLPFSVSTEGFAIAATWMIRQAMKEWILILDADEIITEADKYLSSLMQSAGKDIWSLPRRKWVDWNKKQRMEYESYPDWQVRFFKNRPEYSFSGEMHVRFQSNGDKIWKAYHGPHIEHLQAESRTTEKLQDREVLYKKLADRQGVAIHGGSIRPI